MNWFDILKYQQVEPHDIVTRRRDLFFKIKQLPEFQDKSEEHSVRIANYLKWSLINAAFYNKPIPAKHRVLLRRLIPYTEMGDESRIFNTISVAGNRGIRKLPFDFVGGLGLQGNSSKPFVRRMYARFTLFISEKEVKFKLGKLNINDWYTTKPKEIAKDTAEFIRIWKYMQGYTNVLMDLEVVYLAPNRIKPIKPYEQYSKFDLPKDFASTGGNVSKEGLDKFIENVRKHYLDIEAPQKPFDIGYDSETGSWSPYKGDEE